MSFNKVFLIGHLGRAPELKTFDSGSEVCNFSLATNRKAKNKQGTYEEATEWHNVSAWGRTAENCSQFLGKGSKVFVEGRLQTRKWEDKDGNPRYTTEVVANNVQFLDPKNRTDPAVQTVKAGFEGTKDELPW